MLPIETLLSEAARTFRPLRREDYDRLVEMGAFEDEKIELLEGMLVPMSPQGAHHAKVIQRINKFLGRAMWDRAEVRVQSPIIASDTSEPEPDIALVSIDESEDDHPTTAFLLIEVAESSVAYDLGIKARIYAAAGFPELWVLDLEGRRAIVHRVPADGRYTSITEHDDGATLAVERFPDVQLRLAEVLPRA